DSKYINLSTDQQFIASLEEETGVTVFDVHENDNDSTRNLQPSESLIKTIVPETYNPLNDSTRNLQPSESLIKTI
ncbi:hypothetical protein L9F63_007832, partial [Diploptera punctata]